MVRMMKALIWQCQKKQNRTQKAWIKKKTHVTYEGVAVPEIHFKSKE